MGLFKTSLLTVFMIVISALIITWLVYGIEGLTGSSGTMSFLLNVFLVIILLAFIYKSLSPRLPEQKGVHRDNFGSLLFKILFYIPCLFSNGLDNLIFLFTDKNSVDQVSSIVLILVFILLFYFLSTIQKSIAASPLFNRDARNQSILLTEPVPLNSSITIGSYEELNKYSPPPPDSLQQHNYQYAISFWFYIETEPNQSAFNEYKSIMNYGNKPDVLYRAADNSLLVTMERNGWREKMDYSNKDSKDLSNNSLVLKKIDEYDNDGIYKNSLILYRREKIQLQKWNHIVLNYVNGTLDIFYNGELVKTAIGLVPYMSLDSLTVGSDNGVQGNIRDVVYYNKSLTLDSIHELGGPRP
jgi:hypothetical protein